MDDGSSENHDAPSLCDAECRARLVSLVILMQCNTFSANHHKISGVRVRWPESNQKSTKKVLQKVLENKSTQKSTQKSTKKST